MVFIAAGKSPLCFRMQEKVNRVTVSSRGMLTSLVSQSENTIFTDSHEYSMMLAPLMMSRISHNFQGIVR